MKRITKREWEFWGGHACPRVSRVMRGSRWIYVFLG